MSSDSVCFPLVCACAHPHQPIHTLYTIVYRNRYIFINYVQQFRNVRIGKKGMQNDRPTNRKKMWKKKLWSRENIRFYDTHVAHTRGEMWMKRKPTKAKKNAFENSPSPFFECKKWKTKRKENHPVSGVCVYVWAVCLCGKNTASDWRACERWEEEDNRFLLLPLLVQEYTYLWVDRQFWSLRGQNTRASLPCAMCAIMLFASQSMAKTKIIDSSGWYVSIF